MRQGRIRLALLATAFLLGLMPGLAGSADASFSPADYRDKVVVLDFWASWCVPCRRSFPWLNSMHDKYSDDGLVIVGVNLDNEHDAALAFLEEYPARFRIHYDRDKALAREFGVVAMPSSYLLDRNGDVISKHYGFKVKKQDEYEAAIISALRGTGATP